MELVIRLYTGLKVDTFNTILHLFYGLFENLCFFALSSHLAVDCIDFFSQHHRSQFFFETYLLDETSVLLYLLYVIFEIIFNCSLFNSKLITHLCLHFSEDCMCFCQ